MHAELILATPVTQAVSFLSSCHQLQLLWMCLSTKPPERLTIITFSEEYSCVCTPPPDFQSGMILLALVSELKLFSLCIGYGTQILSILTMKLSILQVNVSISSLILFSKKNPKGTSICQYMCLQLCLESSGRMYACYKQAVHDTSIYFLKVPVNCYQLFTCTTEQVKGAVIFY